MPSPAAAGLGATGFEFATAFLAGDVFGATLTVAAFAGDFAAFAAGWVVFVAGLGDVAFAAGFVGTEIAEAAFGADLAAGAFAGDFAAFAVAAGLAAAFGLADRVGFGAVADAAFTETLPALAETGFRLTSGFAVAGEAFFAGAACFDVFAAAADSGAPVMLVFLANCASLVS